jgi:hypothetical protein
MLEPGEKAMSRKKTLRKASNLMVGAINAAACLVPAERGLIFLRPLK